MRAAGTPARPKSCLVDQLLEPAKTILAAAVLALSAAACGAADLASYRVDNDGVAAPLTDEPGNPARGRQIVRDMGHVTCLICHRMPIPEEPDHGEIGPSLEGVGSRLTDAQLRLRLIDSKQVNPDSVMPSYYRTSGFTRIGAQFEGRPIYSAQQIEDVVAYLALLKDK